MSQKIQFGDADIVIPELSLKKIGSIVVIILVAIFLFSSFYTVNANENGVVLRLGKYSSTTSPGLHFKIPFGIDKVEKVKVDYQYKQEYGFRTVKAGVRTQFSKRKYEYESWMLTGDLNIAEAKWIVQYKIKDPVAYLFNTRDVENTIRDVSEATIRLMIGDRSFNEAMQSERVAIAQQSKVHMQEILDKYNTGISIQLVQLQGVHPPEPVADSFNEVNRAKQEQETLINEARQAYNKEIYRAEGEAEKLINEAEGYAIERTNNAKGDVALFKAVLKEYNKAPTITKDRLFLETMNKVLGKIPNKTIIDSKLESILPLLNLDGKGKK
ncbi:MAG: FtsH protease activity modulator HflK [Candidatus Marinimicrobia bacterium]|nr:FtsH protease activity modulator HflK [Candidatus Neomarinimicrobiota bacterium]MBL7023528.1 FtsH protease activity modulator HflK [Candidatus Neomarinimicrobiota bacterium]MBL7109430.1 FtsH protease activity modulator HflK [Candidatus Neomarinimicrobiota bacterium]